MYTFVFHNSEYFIVCFDASPIQYIFNIELFGLTSRSTNNGWVTITYQILCLHKNLLKISNMPPVSFGVE